MCLYSAILILIHFFLLPLEVAFLGVLSFEQLISTIVAPIYLLVLEARNKTEIKGYKFWTNLFGWLIIVLVGHFLTYCNWGIISGNLLDPDSETILVFKYEIALSILILVIGWIVVFFVKKNNNSKESDK